MTGRSTPRRHPGGIPEGGRFAPGRHTASGVTLPGPDHDAQPRSLVHDALTDIPGVRVTRISFDADGSGVLFDFRDADGDDYVGVIGPGIRRIVAPHPSAGFESITVVPAPSQGRSLDTSECADWIRRHGEQAVRSTAAHRAWEACSGRDLPEDQAFTVRAEPDGTVTAELLVPCGGFDAELVHTRHPAGDTDFVVRVSGDSIYVPPQLREAVLAGLPQVVARQTGAPIQVTAELMDDAVDRTLRSRAYSRT